MKLASIDDVTVERIERCGGKYFRTYVIHPVGALLPQHVHEYDHVTLVMAGRVRGWRGDQCLGDKGAGEAFHIQAHEAHAFESLVPDTRLTCIHDEDSAMSLQRKGL